MPAAALPPFFAITDYDDALLAAAFAVFATRRQRHDALPPMSAALSPVFSPLFAAPRCTPPLPDVAASKDMFIRAAVFLAGRAPLMPPARRATSRAPAAPRQRRAIEMPDAAARLRYFHAPFSLPAAALPDVKICLDAVYGDFTPLFVAC